MIGGEGTARVGTPEETAPIRAGDAIPIQLGEAHAFENKGSAPLEFLIVGVSRDGKMVDVVEVTR